MVVTEVYCAGTLLSRLRNICTRYPRITAAFWRETLIDAAVFREWVTNVGWREGVSRMAHVLCELLVRLWV